MSDPSVLCVMLTADRPQMAARAIRSFHAQTYGSKRLFVLDTGKERCHIQESHQVRHEFAPLWGTIGALRNEANGWAHRTQSNCDIIAHWDSDDWSGHLRLEEQVALLQASGKEAVGYRDMLFWRTMPHYDLQRSKPQINDLVHAQEAWLYSNNDPRYCVGTSLMYWRKTWERRPFPALMRGEDTEWARDVDRVSTSSLCPRCFGRGRSTLGPLGVQPCVDCAGGSRIEPRMIASIHGSNTNTYDIERSENFKRVPEWDDDCRKAMEL